MELSKEQKALYRAVSEIAYTVAYADKEVSEKEITAFQDAIREIMSKGEGIAKHHFDIVNKSIHPDIQASYKHALQLIEENKSALNRVMIRNFLYILEKTAEVLGISENERKIIDQFEKDIYILYQHHKNIQMEAYRSSEQSSLYSTIGQLAYVVAMADHVMMEEEIVVFKQVIKENLGFMDWLAEDRFKIINDMTIMDLESTYDHAMYLIKKNIKALDQSIIEKFIHVMIEVAKVAGITPEENAFIERFKKDIYGILNQKDII